MMKARNIGIIGGAGWLGRSLVAGMLERRFAKPGMLMLSSRTGSNPFASRWPDIEVTTSNQDLVDRCEVIIVSVRPEQFAEVRIDARNRLLVSLMAGVSLEHLQARTGCHAVIRAMPNAALEIGQSYTPWLAAEGVTSEQKAFTQALLETGGTADEVTSEADLDYLTALVGTGPAYPALLADAMLRHALAHGLPAAIAERAVAGVVAGASQLIGRERSAGQLLDMLMGYRGVTAAGLQTMVDQGFHRVINAGLDAAALAARPQDARLTPDQPDQE